MPNFIHHSTILDSQRKQTLDLDLELDLCTECVDNIDLHLNHKTPTELEDKTHLDHEESETLSRCGSYNSKSRSQPIPETSDCELPLSRSRSRSKARSLQRVNQSPLQAQTCVDSFYTPTNRSLPPIIGMHDLQNRQFNENSVSNDRYRGKLNDNDFHFPKSDGIELLNGYVPWDSELNDSDCDDGMFDREQQQVEDMHVDTDSIDCQPKSTEVKSSSQKTRVL